MSTQLQKVDISSYVPPAGPSITDKIQQDSRRRWFFNPAAKINVRDRVVGNEIDPDGNVRARTFIPAGSLTPISNVNFNAPRPKDQPPPPGSTPQEQRLVAAVKYASEIADELAFAYADTGATVIDALTGVEDDQLVRSIFRLCMGPRIKIATDPMLPGEQIPVIPAMLEYLSNEAPASIEKAFEGKNDPKFKAQVEDVRSQLVASCNAALTGWAKFTVEESKQSVADRTGGHPGKAKFDPRDRRAFAALGESIPTEIQPTSPTLEKAVELLLAKELKPATDDPRIAQLERIVAEQQEKLEKLSEKKKIKE